MQCKTDASSSCTYGPAEGETLIDLLRQTATQRASQNAYTFLVDGETQIATLTFAELDLQARAIAALLQSLGASSECVLLLYPSGLEFISGFMGCIYAGAVAIPAPVPKFNRKTDRLATIAADSKARVVLTTQAILSRVETPFDNAPELRSLVWLSTDNIDLQRANDWQPPTISRDSLAFLQYTSGSTSIPRGVMVTHENLLHNERLIQEAFNQSEQSVILNWLPLYHDMGLIGGVLQPLYLGARCILMSPFTFLQKPLRWLRAISKYRVTTSGGPNSAYDLCVRKAVLEDCSGLDLSSWTVAFNGSEPIRAQTIERFTETFNHFGFREQSLIPCYGLAEATLLVSAGNKTFQPLIKTVQAENLKKNQIIDANVDQQDIQSLVASGAIRPEQNVVIVDPEYLTMCSADRIGEIWVSGPSIASGYYNRPEETRQIFHAYLADTGQGPFLRTGDLGFISDGELFVTGRLKDLIIIRGQNYYPQDIESTVHRVSSLLRQGCGAAFAIELDGQERLVVVQEVEGRRPQNLDEVIRQVRQSVVEEHQLPAYAISLIKAGGIPRTSSGKIRRHACRDQFLEGGLDVLAGWCEPSIDKIEDLSLAITGSPGDAASTQEWLVSLLSTRLGVEASTIDTSQPISSYGLDSLAAIELAHDLETTLGVSIPVTTFFQIPSITELTHMVMGLSENSSGQPMPSLQAQECVTQFNLSSGQQALYFLHQLEPNAPVFNIASAGIIRGPLDRAALRRAFQKLVDRHPTLRANFIPTLEGPIQKIKDAVDVYFKEEDAKAWPEAYLDDRVLREANRRFDLMEDRLLWITLYERAEDVLLLMVVHHIVADFWSLGLLLRELAIIYSAEKIGAMAKLPTPRASFSDYVHWHDEVLSGPEGERLWEYWKEKLSGDLPPLDLPTDRLRPPIQTYAGDSLHLKITSETADRLKRLSRQLAITPFVLLAAAFETLLHRYTGQNEILLGAITSGRTLARFADVAGYFVNPVVLRGDFSDDPTFESLLSCMRVTVLEAMAHQDYSFPLLVEKLHKTRDVSRPPLVQTVFIYQKSHLPDEEALTRFAVGEMGTTLSIGEIEIEYYKLNQKVTQFDLTLKMAETEKGFSGSLEFNTDLFDKTTVMRMLDHFQVLIEGIVLNPEMVVSELPLMQKAERHQLLFDWNDTKVTYPENKCIHTLIEEQVKRNPDAVAVSFEKEQITYGELNARSNVVANQLRELGIVSEKLVGICLGRSIEMVVAMLGILKSGGAYVPLDPSFPRERLSLMIGDAGLNAIVAQQRMIRFLPAHSAQIICLDALCDGATDESRADTANIICPDNLAYVIYTSGSTGKPKGVMVSHRNVVNFFQAMDHRLGGDPPGLWLAVTSISFDISVLELLWTLSRGFQVVVQDLEMLKRQTTEHSLPSDEYYSIAAQIRRHGITHLQCTPSMASLISHEPESLNALQNLEKLLLGGEALPLQLAQELRNVVGGQMHNMYGPTETTVWSTMDSVRNPVGRITIGRPIANTNVYILGRNLEPTPINVAGALHIGGEGVVRGYINSPDLTAERFLPDPLSGRAGSRVYSTGDVSRYLQCGNIEFLGRADQQVKLRGHRIELGEIEAALDRHPAICQSALVLQADSHGDGRLVAYVVAEPDSSFDVSDMRELLKMHLPEYMIPSVLIKLDAMPLTPNGKIFLKGLPVAEPGRAEVEKGYHPPRTPVEEVLVGMWADLLDVNEVGIHDDFFQIGGHSILVSRFVSRLREAFKIELSLRKFFEASTVAGLAEALIKDEQYGMKVQRIAELLISIASYSEDEVEMMLGEGR